MVTKFFRIWEVNINIFVSTDFSMSPKKVYNFHNEFHQKYFWINPGASPVHLKVYTCQKLSKWKYQLVRKLYLLHDFFKWLKSAAMGRPPPTCSTNIRTSRKNIATKIRIQTSWLQYVDQNNVQKFPYFSSEKFW